jgi:hypothetical protein
LASMRRSLVVGIEWQALSCIGLHLMVLVYVIDCFCVTWFGLMLISNNS